MKAKPLPSQDYLKELFDYNPETGVLSWIKPLNPRLKISSEAGSASKSTGYRYVSINGKSYKVHRIIWCWVTGDDPGTLQIDHIDRDRSNNAWSNLRLVDFAGNGANKSLYRNNTSGVVGVRQVKEGFRARIVINKKYYQKNFKTFDEAVEWRKDIESYREKLMLSR